MSSEKGTKKLAKGMISTVYETGKTFIKETVKTIGKSFVEAIRDHSKRRS